MEPFALINNNHAASNLQPPLAADSPSPGSKAQEGNGANDQLAENFFEANTIAGGMQPPRKRLNANDRIILCIEVDAIRPFIESRGKKGLAWAQVAANCMKNPNFGVKTDGKKMQEAFNNMIKAVREENETSVYRSGSDEEYTQLRQLLTGLIELVDEFENEVGE